MFLLDQASYLNQYYLALCVALILCFLPAERAFSVDAWLARPSGPPTLPRWSVLALQLQFELMFLYAGLVKINDDWLRGQPLGLWLAQRADLPVIGPWLGQPGVSVAAAYGVVLLHLVGAPLLLWRKTRLSVFVLYVGFHLANAILFRIGMFPWLALVGTLMFFDPDWPRTLWHRINGESERPLAAEHAIRPSPPMPRPACVLLSTFFVLQLLVPLRFLAYPGNVAWTREGEMFSWRMKLNDSQGSARFVITEPASQRHWEVNPRDFLGSRQVMMMSTNPDMILQFAHYLGRTWAEREAVPYVEVRAVVWCSLNGRRPTLLVDPEHDLTRVSRTWKPPDWILPLTVPLDVASLNE